MFIQDLDFEMSERQLKKRLLLIYLKSLPSIIFSKLIPPFPIYIFSKKIKKLKQGIVFFNRWIVFATFENTNVKGYTLINSSVYHCKVYDCVMINCSAGETYFENVRMFWVHTFDSDLENCHLHKGSLFHCKVCGTKLNSSIYSSNFNVCEIKSKAKKTKNNFFDLCILHLNPDDSNRLKESVIVEKK